MLTPDPTTYYTSFGPLTAPGPFADLYRDLPCDLDALCAIVNGLIVHDLWINMGLQISEERQKEAELRSVQAKLRRIVAMDPRPLSQPRPFEERLFGNCRDESQMLCSFLRYHGIPARARVGFQVTSPENKLDHVICQVWSASNRRWQTVDVQMDNLKREQHRLPPQAQAFLAALNPQDAPPESFLTGAQAWQKCRAGEDDPNTYRITDDRKGWWFIRNNLLRDLLALNKYELIPWDTIPGSLMSNDRSDPTPEQYAFLDHVAGVILSDDLSAIQTLYQETPSLRFPESWLEN